MLKKLLPLLVVIGLAGGGVYYFKKPGGDEAAQAAGGQGGPPGGGPGMGGMPVEAQKVSVGALDRTIEAVGTLISNESVTLSPEISGRVTEILFEEGQDVLEGDELVLLDDSVFRAELAEAQAALSLSRSNFQRAKELLARQTGTERARDEALAALNSDQARVDLAKVRMDKTVIRAPFSGLIGLRHISLGDYVNPGQDLVNLESINPLKVDFRVAETYLDVLKAGQKISVAIDAFPGKTFAGEVYAIDPRIDSAGRNIILRAKLPNTEGLLRPGLFARVNLIVEKKNDSILIPEQALIPMGDNQFVYRVVDGKSAMTPVVTGARRHGQVEIVKGLGPEDTVITAGHMKIGPDMPVTVLPAPAEPAGGNGAGAAAP